MEGTKTCQREKLADQSTQKHHANELGEYTCVQREEYINKP